MNEKLLYEDLTEKIIKCFYKVHDALGDGFLESVYEKALLIELEDAGFKAESQRSLTVYYKGRLVGDFKADIVIEDKIVIEIKAVSRLAPHHEAQLINYLKATGIKVDGLVRSRKTLDLSFRTK